MAFRSNNEGMKDDDDIDDDDDDDGNEDGLIRESESGA
jgi:hypothetical protein